ncbi:MAG: protein-glutamate O-methyltransferase CheR [Verrucomicrobiota bacterium]
MTDTAPDTLENLELTLLLEGVFQQYGYDFRHYAVASIKRRVLARLAEEKLATVSELQARLLHDPAAFERFLLGLTVHVTALFRDPGFYQALRAQAVPWLRTYPFVRLWVAGCSTGEEVYSLAILLQEETLYDRCRIYATDLGETVLAKAKAGIFPLASMQEYSDNYFKAGGQQSFSEYYTASHDHAILSPALRRNVLFAQHNLVTDASFNEFHLVLCRNVMIYFDKTLQDRVHQLLYDSLAPLGLLGLGRNESLRFTPCESGYEEVDAQERIYRKKR